MLKNWRQTTVQQELMLIKIMKKNRQKMCQIEHQQFHSHIVTKHFDGKISPH